MNLSQSDLHILSQKAITAAKEAGKLINSYANKNVIVNNKEAADSLASQVVTEVDVKAQNKILKILNPTLSEYDLALLTEESTDDESRFEKDYFWCIDPMDGTLAFTEKTPGYAVSIALVSKSGVPLIGVVYDPVTDNLYHAISEHGAFKNRHVWQPDLSIKNNSSFNLYIDRSFRLNKHCKNILEEIEEAVSIFGFKNLHIEELAGAVLNAIWVLDKAPGSYFKIPKPQTGGGSLWDFAATACIIEEAGAYGKSLDGSPLDLNRCDSTFMNHKGALYASNTKIASIIKTILVKYPYERQD